MIPHDLEALSKPELIRELKKLLTASPHLASTGDQVESERLLHNLRVHQLELEMQNRELREAQVLLEESRNRYADLYDFAPIGYCTLDPGGGIQEINLTGATLLGIPRDELTGRQFSSLAAIGDRALVQAHMRRCRASDGEPVTTEMTVSSNRPEGLVVQMVSVPLHGSEPLETVYRTALIDVSTRKRLETKLRFLAETGQALAASLDYQTTIAAVAQLAVPMLADLCIVDVVDETGKLRRLEVVFADERKQQALAEQIKQFSPSPGWQTPQTKVVASGQPMRLAEISEVLRDRIAHDEAHASSMRAAGITSMMIVPLCARGQTLGTLTLAAAESDRHYSPADLLLAEDIGRRAGMAIENAHLHDQARHAIHAREALLALVAHDLRNPLGVILLQTDLLLSVAREDDRRLHSRKSAESIGRSANRMNRLIKDLLDVASIEAERLSMERVPQPVPPLLEEAVEMSRAMASQRSLRLELDLPLGVSFDVTCDRGRMLQVLGNLIGNAIKFSREGGSIVVRAERHEVDVRFSVADRGPGIPPESLPHIFDRFWQAKKTARLGTGLGLSIVKGIVEAHGGRVWVESELGVGTTCFFTLPLSPSRSSSQAVEDVPPIQSDACAAEHADVKVILIVDDEPDARDALSDILRNAGHAVATAANGAEALAYLQDSPPPFLILLDLTMPVMDGWEFLDARTQDPVLRSIPVVVVSGQREIAGRVAMASAEYIEKPLRPDHLRETIERLRFRARPA